MFFLETLRGSACEPVISSLEILYVWRACIRSVYCKRLVHAALIISVHDDCLDVSIAVANAMSVYVLILLIAFLLECINEFFLLTPCRIKATKQGKWRQGEGGVGGCMGEGTCKAKGERDNIISRFDLDVLHVAIYTWKYICPAA